MALISGPDGYELEKCLYSGGTSEVYAAGHDRDGRQIVLKAYVLGHDADPAAQARREFEALQRVAGRGIVRAIEIVPDGTRAHLVLERVPGVRLAEWVQTSLPSPEDAVAVAIQLTEALARVHSARLLHGGIHPWNILVDPETLQTHLIGFGRAQPLGANEQRSETQGWDRAYPGIVQYISPEQTGRMDRGRDFRSDLYSLGATLYYSLTGKPPFDANDTLGLIHAHLARVPIPVVERRPALPATLSRIAAKLLQKGPEDRYQTAHALARDLRECQEQLERTGTIQDDLPLGTADAPFRPLFGKRLYGRESEVRALRDAYERACDGQLSVLLVRGTPGIGKSALVHELREVLAATGGHLAQGKFDLYRRDLPYNGFLQVFESLLQQILTESDARLAYWRGVLQTGLGAVAGALVELVPDLGLVLGEVSPVPVLGPKETRSRLALAVQRFLSAVATKDHPLVLFLDDLQWTDAASRELLATILIEPQACALLLIGSYRDNEVDPQHPLARFLKLLESGGLTLPSLALEPLSEEACAKMLGDALGRSSDEARELARCVARKTGNTPLFIQQFVHHMYDLGLIRFEAGTGWTWDSDALAAADIPDDAAALMTAKIGRLAPDSAQVLELASCVGDVFELDTLAELTDSTRESLAAALFALCDEGLIAPAQTGFRFVHDRIREAAQNRLSSDARLSLHLRAGRLLLARVPEAELAGRSFEIADHLNHVGAQLEGVERERALEINLLAGRRALTVGAAVTASHYLGAARALFVESDWDARPSQSFDLVLLSAESAYQMSDLDLARKLLASLENRRLDRMQEASVAAMTISVRTLMEMGQLAPLGFVLDTLRRFGVRWPEQPSRLRTRAAIWWTDLLLRGPLDEKQLRPIGPGDHSRWLAPLTVMNASAALMSLTTVRLPCLMLSFCLRFYRRQGYVRPPGRVLGGYAAYRLAVLGHLRGAERLAKAAQEWAVREPDPVYTPRSEFNVYAFVYGWIRPRRSVLEPLWNTMERCVEVGDIEYALYSRALRITYLALCGEPLSSLASELAKFHQRAGWRGGAQPDQTGVTPNSLWIHTIRLLRVGPAPGKTLSNEIASIEAEFANRPSNMIGMRTVWIQAMLLLGHFQEALESADRIADTVYEIRSTASHVVDYSFIRGMAAAALASERRGAELQRLRRTLRSCLRRVEVWAEHGPDFEHMVLGLRAERARLRGRSAHALATYKQAAERATSQGHVHHAALFHERRARLLVASRRTTESASAFTLAAALFNAWGAEHKATMLQREQNELCWTPSQNA